MKTNAVELRLASLERAVEKVERVLAIHSARIDEIDRDAKGAINLGKQATNLAHEARDRAGAEPKATAARQVPQIQITVNG